MEYNINDIVMDYGLSNIEKDNLEDELVKLINLIKNSNPFNKTFSLKAKVDSCNNELDFIRVCDKF